MSIFKRKHRCSFGSIIFGQQIARWKEGDDDFITITQCVCGDYYCFGIHDGMPSKISEDQAMALREQHRDTSIKPDKADKSKK